MSKKKQSLKDAETLRMLVWNLPAGIYITSAKGEILDVNPGCLELFGVPSLQELRKHSAQDLYVDPAQRERQMQLLERKGYISDFEIQLRHPESGQVRTVLDTCYSVPNLETGDLFYHGILLDITERKELEGQVEELSIRDPLTGCFNRRYLDRVETCLVGDETPWGAIVVAIDHFREYNIEHGHRAGDELLMRMSSFVHRQVRTEDVVVRTGGDEFLVLLVDESAPSTEVVAQRMQDQSREAAPAPFTLGWAVREGQENVEQTIHRANEHLIQVRIKERGLRRRRRSSSKCLVPQ